MTDDYSKGKKDEKIVIIERRKAKRLKEDNEFTISVISKDQKQSKEKIIYTLGKNISTIGAKIQANSYLPADTILGIKITLTDPPQVITAFGKVKWAKMLSANGLYEAGLEFVNTSAETIQRLADYVSQKI